MNREELKNATDFLDWIDRVIKYPDKPSIGDYICLDADGNHPSVHNQGISWYASKVVDVDGDQYLVEYNDGERSYTFKDFDVPFLSKRGTGNLIYPALPPINH